jgi:SAM-dependent methyltransferase
MQTQKIKQRKPDNPRALAKLWADFVCIEKRMKRETPFIINHSPKENPWVFDSALGCGATTIGLHMHGINRVLGNDIDPGMIEDARIQAIKRGLLLITSSYDWRDIRSSLSETFDVVTCLGNSLTLVFDRDEQLKALRNFRMLLRDSGVLMIDERNYPRILEGGFSHSGEYVYCGIDRVSCKPTNVDADLVTMEYAHKQTGDVDSLHLYPFKAGEMFELLHEAGFSGIETFGDYRADFDPSDVEFYTYVARTDKIRNQKHKTYMSLADLWDITRTFMWDHKYVAGLDQFLRSQDVTTILDVAGGTGFPCLELRRMGWDITYSDGSNLMLGHFKKRMEGTGQEIPQHHSNWLELSQNIPGKYDAVLCRGNSLIYVDSWDQCGVHETTKERIKKSLAEFYKTLNDGGLLYVDITNKSEFDQQTYPIIEKLGERIISDKPTRLIWELTHDYEGRIRTCNSTLSHDGQEYKHTYQSYLLRHEELVEILKEVGFRKVEETKIDGEDSYTVFVARK